MRVQKTTYISQDIEMILLSEVVLVVAIDEVDAFGLVDGLLVEERTAATYHYVLYVLVLFLACTVCGLLVSRGFMRGHLLFFFLFGCFLFFFLFSRLFGLFLFLSHDFLVLHLHILQANLNFTLDQPVQIRHTFSRPKTLRLKVHNIIFCYTFLLNHFIQVLFASTQLLNVINKLSPLLLYVDLFIKAVVNPLGK
jgi:hypothetical protein